MNFDQVFPQVKQRFAIKLNLLSSKKKYDFTQNCEGIDIQNTFDQAVKKFNSNKQREVDGGLITEYEIRPNTIFLALEIYKGKYKKIKNMVGNALSKMLYSKYGWKKLTNKKLFKMELKQLEDKKLPKMSNGIKVNVKEEDSKDEEKTDFEEKVEQQEKKTDPIKEENNNKKKSNSQKKEKKK